MAIFEKGARRIRTPFENETIQSTSGGLLSTRDSIQPRSRSNATEGTIGGEEGGKKAARGMRPFSLSRSISRDRACVFLARIIPGNLEPGRPGEIPRLDKS